MVWDREGCLHAGGGHPADAYTSFCRQSLLDWSRDLMFMLVSSRYERASLIVTSNKSSAHGARSLATTPPPPP
jgi:hypothetical protein